ncbi:MAG: hypothetical protein KJ043_10965 [Anaerolineae bacterium]|nr:hypothetical protein [Anaerolineae bacterium]
MKQNNAPVQLNYFILGVVLCVVCGAFTILAYEIIITCMLFILIFLAIAFMIKYIQVQPQKIDRELTLDEQEKQHLASKPVILQAVPNMQYQAKTHAIDAVESLGLDFRFTPVLLLDIGFIGFFPNKTRIYRLAPLLEELDAIQPFIKVYVKHATKKHIHFEILDVNNHTVFVFEMTYSLKIGEHLITPPARMPLGDVKHKNGIWKLRILLDNAPLAEHHFGWQADSQGFAKMPMSLDGELSEELTAEFQSAIQNSMSLDELLGNEGDESAHKNS